MTATPRHRSGAAGVIWFAAFVVVLGGYVLAFRIVAVRIDERLDQITRSAERVRADERVVAERPRLEVEQAQLRARLSRVALDDDATRLVSRFVHDAARVAERHRTKVTAIAAAAAAAIAASNSGSIGVSSSPSASALPADRFQAIPLEVTLEGRYIDLLAALRELSATRVLASVELVSLVRKNIDAPDATLTAALHVALERLAQTPPSPTAPQTREVRSGPQ